MEGDDYKENHFFWTEKGDRLTVIGDYLGRLPSLKLLDAKKGEYVLDAGCGAGFIARKMALTGAKVFGCDRAEAMVQRAVETEKRCSLGIEYKVSDITTLPYKNNQFDAVACVAVLIHDSPEECKKFIAEAHRVLKSEGRLLISVTHPFVYQPESPNRTGKTNWAVHSPLDNKPMTENQRFNEIYTNSEGKQFSSTVWYHPIDFFPKALSEAGFSIVHEQTMYMTKEALEACGHTGPIGYPSFYQILTKKY
ncbi:methyltransferase domain-containing protein [Candidatus Kaiserbacteria bacterium]|nr:methyltransferase domain-containing protein [Candidatus Kaiserbacteria bacterium]